MRTIIIVALFAFYLYSCEQNKTDTTALASSFADIECKAMQLREQRFALANKIRFTEDTLLHNKDADTARLKAGLANMQEQKTQILSQSLTLADEIKHKLDSVMHGSRLTAAEKSDFNAKLNAMLEKKYCLATITAPTLH